MKNLLIAGSLAFFSAIAPCSASAASIIYSFSGDYSGSANGDPFSGSATLTGIGDTSTEFNPTDDVTAVGLSSLTFTVNNVSKAISGNNVFFVNRFAGTGGFSLLTGGDFRTLLLSSSFLTYDGVSSIAAVTGSAVALPYNFSSNTDQFTVTSASNLKFSATAAVPEPATWAMMILGFGAIGAILRYRRRAAKVSFA